VDGLPVCPHVVVNAVGNANLALILDQDVAGFRRIVEIELVGGYNVLRAAARRMVRESVAGSIVSISSENEEYPSRGLSGHCSAKAGLAMLTRVAAVELGPRGIRVNAVAPGCTATPLTAPFAGVPSYAAAVAATTPLGGRMGQPAEIAAAVAFLASDDARWITGQSLRTDGGQSLVAVPDPLDAVAAAGADTRHGPGPRARRWPALRQDPPRGADLGPRRFRPPAAPARREGVRDAARPGPACRSWRRGRASRTWRGSRRCTPRRTRTASSSTS
jgi:3-oxoacyl-[acyl-carrier protein] reductase